VALDVANRTLLSRLQAAAVLGCSVRSVDRLRRRGRLPAVQFLSRGRVHFRLEDVEALLEPEGREPHPARAEELSWR
jgi:excisionase family DNA binding protein